MPPGHNPCFSGQCFAIDLVEDLKKSDDVTILVLVDSVLQYFYEYDYIINQIVTILVLVDSVLQSSNKGTTEKIRETSQSLF